MAKLQPHFSILFHSAHDRLLTLHTFASPDVRAVCLFQLGPPHSFMIFPIVQYSIARQIKSPVQAISCMHAAAPADAFRPVWP